MNTKNIISIGLISSVLLLNGCTPEEQALATGLAMGAMGGSAIATSRNVPQYYDKPFYYYHGNYYYGGRYYNGCYYHNGHRYYGGHYYKNGYRYHNGRKYRARVGQYGYYRNRNDYNRYKKDNYNNIGYRNNSSNLKPRRVGSRVYTPSSHTRGGWN
jgi:hypothetical protein